MGSYVELQYYMGGRTPAYRRVRDQLRGKDWGFVGFTDKHVIVRVGDENIEYDRKKGTVKQRVKLFRKKS